MEGLIIDNHSKYIQKIVGFLKSFKIDSKIIDYVDFRIDKSLSFDFFILSGGDIEISNNKLLQQEKQLVRKVAKPIFGICCGFQVISHVYGGIISKLSKKVEGVITIDLHNMNELDLQYSSDMLDVFESNLWIVEKPLKDFTILGSSKYGIEIIKHNSKPILATQFHPEVQENNNGKIIFQYFIEKIFQESNEDLMFNSK